MSKNTELLGVKIKSDTKERITKLTDQAKAAGMIELNGDIFDLFVERFEQDELTKQMAYGADLKELHQITRRINDIFVNLSKRNETNLENLKLQHERITVGLNEEIKELREKKKELQELLTEKSNEIKELTDLDKVNHGRIKELEDVHIGYTERIEEQKSIIDEKDEKIANKNELISEKEEAIAAMKEDIAQNDELKKKIDSLHTEISHLQQTIASKNEELTKQKESLEFECQKRVFAREQELNKEKEKEIRIVQDELTKETKRYQEKYEKVLEEKEKLRSANYELKATIDREQNANERKGSLIAQKEEEILELKKRMEQLEAQIKKK